VGIAVTMKWEGDHLHVVVATEKPGSDARYVLPIGEARMRGLTPFRATLRNTYDPADPDDRERLAAVQTLVAGFRK